MTPEREQEEELVLTEWSHSAVTRHYLVTSAARILSLGFLLVVLTCFLIS